MPAFVALPTWAPPAVVAAAAAAGCATLAVADPNQPGTYPTCPFLALTGRWCPGCGSLRGLRALLGGDVGAALGFNTLMVVALPFLAYRWFAWALPRFGGPRLPAASPPAAAIWGFLVLVVAFAVLRNLPLDPFTLLAP